MFHAYKIQFCDWIQNKFVNLLKFTCLFKTTKHKKNANAKQQIECEKRIIDWFECLFCYFDWIWMSSRSVKSVRHESHYQSARNDVIFWAKSNYTSMKTKRNEHKLLLLIWLKHFYLRLFADMTFSGVEIILIVLMIDKRKNVCLRQAKIFQ